MCSRICSSQNEIESLLESLKTVPCPHCKRTGNLFKHGFLMGYDEQHQLAKTVRARRVYCSNRMHATGCGRTFSLWIADRIKHTYLSAKNLWQFLNEAVDSGNKLQAFRKLESGLKDSAAYSIWRRFINAQPAIRTAIAPLCQPPQIDSSSPAKLTLEHLALAFRAHPLSPIAAFAVTLQAFFF